MTPGGGEGPVSGVVGWTSNDLHAWQILRPLLAAGRYLPWSTGAMRPAGLVEVCNMVVLDGRQRIVELGAGSSTVLLARLARERPGATVDAVEHSERWAGWVAEQLTSEGLDDVARVHHVPLQAGTATDAAPWYAAAALLEALGDAPIDLLVVDGPPAFAPGEGQARRPALPALEHRLAGDAVVVLDDLARPGERAVLEHWERETAWRFERRSDAGIAIGRRRR